MRCSSSVPCDGDAEIAHADVEQLLVASSVAQSGSVIQRTQRSAVCLLPPFGVAFVGVGDAEERRLVERAAGQLQADRQPIGREPARHADRRQAGEVRADREDVGQVHLQRIGRRARRA